MNFRQKPVVVEARQLTVKNQSELRDWCSGTIWSRVPMRAVTGISIPTLEGEIHVPFYDWIILGVMGEFYSCKPDIFEATYEKVE